MKYPSHFDFVFWLSMALVALCLASVAIVSVVCFGNVTNGSLTAFLLDNYQDGTNNRITEWIMFANTTVSLSVLLTYPLTMYPAIELLGPILQRNAWLSRFFGGSPGVEDEDDLAAFEPLPPLPEHDAVSQHELDEQHSYEIAGPLGLGGSVRQQDEDALSGISSFIGAGQTFFTIHFVLPGDSAQLRVTLVLTTYLIAIGIPNVQALISLVGAMAGSSAALLIPPVLELAWVEHVEHIDEAMPNTPFAGAASPMPSSPHMLRKQKLRQKRKEQKWWDCGKYWKTKVKCYVSFTLGVVFLGIGTGFSVVDIVDIYRQKAA
uniref:Amino acid transporter transmembrane domain-containing protein n=1 Tax=Amphora coffeiformis TaxID=265554 RepID=A0A7S3L0B0_9STRA